ncbi:MAG TPA: DUF4136 domain-containing protein [Saprospiraceae bacterium]|nr:DUF4136 domain-containing protein [Saprospiraceae bacterium]
MKSAFLFLVLLAILLIHNSCSSVTKVYSEEEPGINLYKYRTFDWLETKYSKQGNNGPEWLNERAEAKIRSSTEAQMARYGLKPCDDRPDLMLHFHVVIKNEVFYIQDWWCDEETGTDFGRCNRLRPVNYQEGTLVIDFIDAKTGSQVWRGAAAGALDNLSPEKADARIEEAVRLIFEKYPEKPIPST